MKRLILDHFRRWSWVLALCALLEFGLGWFIATGPKFTFEFWAFLLALWTGATLVSFDLRRGALRALGPLPLTGTEIGRGWWLATVPIPAIVLTAMLFLGATTFCRFHPSQVFPADRLAMASLFTLAWLGMGFTLIFNSLRGFYGSWWELACNFFINALSIIAFFGSMVLAQGASKSPFKSAVLLGLGAVFTAVGWLRAEQFDLGRAGLYLGHAGQVDLGRPGQSGLARPGFRLTPLEPRIPPGQHRAPGGYGAIPFLIRTSFVRAFSYIVAMVALMALLLYWQGQRISRPQDIVLFVAMGSFMSCWFIVFYQLMPVLRQLRFLRTLPISATGLAAVMIGIAILPLVALGTLVAGVSGPALGTSAAITVLSSYTFILAPTALCVFFAVWRGAGKQAYALSLLTMFGFFIGGVWLQTFFHYPEIPFTLGGPVAAISILLAFLLTRRALMHSSHAYRVQANNLGNLPGGMGR
jgi:hypothetical protein